MNPEAALDVPRPEKSADVTAHTGRQISVDVFRGFVLIGAVLAFGCVSGVGKFEMLRMVLLYDVVVRVSEK